MKATRTTSRVWMTLGLMLAGIWLAGCRSTPSGDFSQPAGAAPAAASTTPSTPAPPAVAGETGAEIIKIGDTLTFVFSDVNPAIQPISDTVKGDGTVTLLQNKSFKVVGKTRGVVEQEVRAFYVPSYYINLTVNIASRDQSYTVGGEVRTPNRYQYIGRTTVTRAIQSAGYFTDFARRTKVRLYRANGKIEVVDCLAASQNPKLDLEVFPGDSIEVPRRTWPWQK